MGEIKLPEDDQSGLAEEDFSEAFLAEAKGWIQQWGWALTIAMVIVWPLPSLPAGVLTKGYSSMWVFISIAWSFIATFVITWLPLYVSTDTFKGILSATTGGGVSALSSYKWSSTLLLAVLSGGCCASRTTTSSS